MGNSKTGEVENDAATETMIDYKRGLKNLDTGSKLLSSQTGLGADLSAMILKSMKRDNLSQIQASIKESERPKKSNIKKSNHTKTDKKGHDTRTIEIIIAYKKGSLNLHEASSLLTEATGLTAETAISLLSKMKRQNTIRLWKKE